MLVENGIPAAEDFPSEGFQELTQPVAALSLEKVDCQEGTAYIAVRLLSPRRLGGWRCQAASVAAASHLAAAGFFGETGQMEYLSGSDCFCVKVTVLREICLADGGWTAGKSWKISWNDQILSGVESFTAQEDRGRRMVGAFWQAEQVGVTPGVTGWNITLVQRFGPGDAEPEEPEEPFTLTVERDARTVSYGACYWNKVTRRHSQQGLVVERSGFALTREVI